LEPFINEEPLGRHCRDWYQHSVPDAAGTPHERGEAPPVSPGVNSEVSPSEAAAVVVPTPPQAPGNNEPEVPETSSEGTNEPIPIDYSEIREVSIYVPVSWTRGLLQSACGIAVTFALPHVAVIGAVMSVLPHSTLVSCGLNLGMLAYRQRDRFATRMNGGIGLRRLDTSTDSLSRALIPSWLPFGYQETRVPVYFNIASAVFNNRMGQQVTSDTARYVRNDIMAHVAWPIDPEVTRLILLTSEYVCQTIQTMNRIDGTYLPGAQGGFLDYFWRN
jgi:hypothetical protein